MAATHVSVAIAGAAGRMGQTLIAMLAQRPEFRLCAAWEGEQHPQLGEDSGQIAGVAANHVPLSVCPSAEGDTAGAEVLIDFSRTEAILAHLHLCRRRSCALVLGTTGWGEEIRRELSEAAREIPIVCAPNMSTGVNVFFRLLEIAATAFGAEADAEIIEAHHRHKQDAPSGTALKIGEIVAAARGVKLEDCAVHGRHGGDVPRAAGEIGFSVLRGGMLAGEHELRLISDTEELSIRHRAFDRKAFAAGALRAALWLQGRSPGLYDMRPVLGLQDS